MVPSPPCETPARFLEAVHGVRDHGVTLMGQPDRCYPIIAILGLDWSTPRTDPSGNHD